MDKSKEEEFYEQQKNMPTRQPTYTPFGVSTVISTSNNKSARWIARVLVTLFLAPILGFILLLFYTMVESLIKDKSTEYVESSVKEERLIKDKSNIQSNSFYFDQGLKKAQSGDFYGAISDFNKDIEINPQKASSYFNRGKAKGLINDHNGAISDYTKAIEINPRDANTYFNRGLNKADLKDYYGAVSDFSNTIKINPKDSDAYVMSAKYKGMLGDQEGACSDIKRAMNLGDKEALDIFNKACK